MTRRLGLPTGVRFGICLLALVVLAPSTLASGIVYSNSGNNTDGFVTVYGTGSMKSDGVSIIESRQGTWALLPIRVTGDFQVSFDVLNNSGDGDTHLLLVDPKTHGGIDIKNCPQDTDTPSNTISAGTDLSDYKQLFFPDPEDVLITKPTTSFPFYGWTHIVITRKGNIITDQVGKQVLQADVTRLNLPRTVAIGLGGYATPINGLQGTLSYQNLEVVADEGHRPSADDSDTTNKPAAYQRLKTSPLD